MKIFRASYSVLSLWESGQKDRAIECYFKLPSYTSQQMADGKMWHDKWQEHIEKTKTLPAEFGNLPLVKPQTELKIVKQLEDWLELVGRIDCFDDGIVHEFKTGVSESNEHGTTYQGGIYGLLATLSDMTARQVVIHHWNQYTKKADVSIYWITPEVLKDSLRWVKEIAWDMYQEIINYNVEEKLGIKQ